MDDVESNFVDHYEDFDVYGVFNVGLFCSVGIVWYFGPEGKNIVRINWL